MKSFRLITGAVSLCVVTAIAIGASQAQPLEPAADAKFRQQIEERRKLDADSKAAFGEWRYQNARPRFFHSDGVGSQLSSETTDNIDTVWKTYVDMLPRIDEQVSNSQKMPWSSTKPLTFSSERDAPEGKKYVSLTISGSSTNRNTRATIVFRDKTETLIITLTNISRTTLTAFPRTRIDLLKLRNE